MKENELFPIPSNISVFQDKKTGARTIALPFDFNTGHHGVLMITRLSSFTWVPAEDIKSVVINFTNDDSQTA